MSAPVSYFGKSILLIFLSIISFLGFKQVLPDRLFAAEPMAPNNNIVVDNLMLEAIADTTAVSTTSQVAATDSTEMDGDDQTYGDPTLTVDGYNNLKRFYAKLQNLEKDKAAKVRIAYFGDSMNDGDFIVQDVRSEFQDKYGGQGVGFVAVSSLSASARGSISHQYSKGWKSQSFLKVKKPRNPFGIDGQVFFANTEGQWVKYRAQSQKHATQLDNPTLFFGRSANHNGYVTIKADKDSLLTKSLTPSGLLNTLSLGNTAKIIQVNFVKADTIPIYGLNFDDGKGVHVDNFSTRGNSGLPLSILNPSVMNAFDKVLEYDLIVLQYGANVLGYGSTKYGWYEKSMTTVVNNLKECFPNADILIISTADKATKIEAEMQTDPAVVPLAKSQKNYAQKTGSAYINLYTLMGGNGSMIKWVNEGSAGKDYTHFTAKGSKKIGKLLFNEIEKGYSKYKSEHSGE